MFKTVDKATEALQAYHKLREGILQGELLPGQRLVENDLARRYGFGRAAIRTALARLEQEGLVESAPYRGAWVRVITLGEAVEILEARTALETLAARYAAERALPEEIQALFEILAAMEKRKAAGDLGGVSELNEAFHRTILGMARSRTLAQLVESLKAQGVRYRFRTILVPGRPEASLAEHRRIAERILARDGEGAARAMAEHLEGVKQALLRLGEGV